MNILESSLAYSMCFTGRYELNNNEEITKTLFGKGKIIFNTKDVVEGFIPHKQTIVMRNYINLVDFLKKNTNHPSGNRLIAYYGSLVNDIYYLDELTACYRISGEGVWSSFDNFIKFLELKEILSI